jgi:hypothetical protein
MKNDASYRRARDPHEPSEVVRESAEIVRAACRPGLGHSMLLLDGWRQWHVQAKQSGGRAGDRGKRRLRLLWSARRKRCRIRRFGSSPTRTRTWDMVINSHPLYQLSYRGRGAVFRV